ncbi:MAG: SOS response-associated peptidase [Saprospiraceae bacterium]|nr:SOS response-associated peptidase [Saprospiraceae bacterium]
MCGRFSLAVSESKIQEELPFVDTGNQLRRNYNIAPTQHAYVVTNAQPDRLQYLTWGLVPFWSKEGKNTGRLINARAEGIESKPSFRIPIRKQRCLVLADSFYEWRKSGSERIPYRILPKNGSLLIMAGIWDEWDKEGYPVKSFSVITCQPNEEVAFLHDRMPVLLTNKEACAEWLDDIPLDDVFQYLSPAPNDYLKLYRVPSNVNNIRNNGPELHEEIPESLDLFSQR